MCNSSNSLGWFRPGRARASARILLQSRYDISVLHTTAMDAGSESPPMQHTRKRSLAGPGGNPGRREAPPFLPNMPLSLYPSWPTFNHNQ